MECDSMHSVIERKIKIDICTDRDYYLLISTARLHPQPYVVKQLRHTDFKKMDGGFLSSIRPGKKAGDPKVHNLRSLHYRPNGEVLFKLSFTEEGLWEQLPQRSRPVDALQWSRMFSAQIPLKQRKYQDLQSMKIVLPKDCHSFYDDLPCQNA